MDINNNNNTSHDWKRPYHCKVCPSKFKSNRELIEHENSHTVSCFQNFEFLKNCKSLWALLTRWWAFQKTMQRYKKHIFDCKNIFLKHQGCFFLKKLAALWLGSKVTILTEKRFKKYDIFKKFIICQNPLLYCNKTKNIENQSPSYKILLSSN